MEDDDFESRLCIVEESGVSGSSVVLHPSSARDILANASSECQGDEDEPDPEEFEEGEVSASLAEEDISDAFHHNSRLDSSASDNQFLLEALLRFGDHLKATSQAPGIYCSSCFEKHMASHEKPQNDVKYYSKELSLLHEEFDTILSQLKPLMENNMSQHHEDSEMLAENSIISQATTTPCDSSSQAACLYYSNNLNDTPSSLTTAARIQSSLSHVLGSPGRRVGSENVPASGTFLVEENQNNNNILEGGSSPTGDTQLPIKLPQHLDTSAVSVLVRKTLSENNIGQRVFARHVLHLSQGTVSEMLAKPKHWTRLSHKSKESYMKMFQWVNDPRRIAQLRTLMPKKSRVFHNTTPTMILKKEDPTTVNRIQSLLNRAQREMSAQQMLQKTISSSDNMAVPVPQPTASSLSSTIPLNSQAANLVSITTPSPSNAASVIMNGFDTSTGAKVLAMDGSSNCFMNLVSSSEGLNMESVVASLSKHLGQTPQMITCSSANGTMTSQATPVTFTSIRCATLAPSPAMASLPPGSYIIATQPPTAATASAGTLIPASAAATLRALTPSAALSSGQHVTLTTPQQHTTLPPGTLAVSSVTTPVLPIQIGSSSSSTEEPATYTEATAGGDMNTAEIVAEVKDALSQHAISQRMFGEVVLGLSQGSVSDLLSRPKPWPGLTPKGREPYLRMRSFLQALRHIDKQRKADLPQSLMGTLDTNSDLPANQLLSLVVEKLQTMQQTASDQTDGKCQEEEENAKENHVDLCEEPAARMQETQQQHDSDATTCRTDSPDVQLVKIEMADNYMGDVNVGVGKCNEPPPPTPSPHLRAWFSRVHEHGSCPTRCIDHLLREAMTTLAPLEENSNLMASAHTTMPSLSQVTVEELCRVARCVSPTHIVLATKKVLLEKSIGQRLLGKKVLGMCQASVSELLCRERQWDSLSLKSREPFIRLLVWLSQSRRVDQLSQLQMQLRADKAAKKGHFLNQIRNGTDFSGGNEMPLTQISSMVEVPQTVSQSLQTIQPVPQPQVAQLPSNTIVLTNATMGHLIGQLAPGTSLPTALHLSTNNAGAGANINLQVSSATPVMDQTSLLNALVSQLAQNVSSALLQTNSSENVSNTSTSPALPTAILVQHNPQSNFTSGTTPSLVATTTTTASGTGNIMNPMNVVTSSALPTGGLVTLMPSVVKSEVSPAPASLPRKIIAAPVGLKRMPSTLLSVDNPDSTSRRTSGGGHHSHSNNSSGDYCPAPLKRSRVVFSNYQRQELTAMFKRNPYPKAHESDELATRLNLTKKSISNWFHNHRVRSKGYGSHSGYKSKYCIEPPGDMGDGTVDEEDGDEKMGCSTPSSTESRSRSSSLQSRPTTANLIQSTFSPESPLPQGVHYSSCETKVEISELRQSEAAVTTSRKRKAANPTRVVQPMELLGGDMV